MAKIHVIADEKLGGVRREFIEVDRKAEVGDYGIQKSNWSGKKGNIGRVGVVYEDGSGARIDGEPLMTSEYKILEPTDIVIIDGPDGQPARHRLVDRKAEVGDKVLVINHGCYAEANGVFTVDDANSDGHIYYGEFGRRPNGYFVLEPVDLAVEATADDIAEATADDPDSMLDLMANLARRVTELEKTVEAQDKAIHDQSQRHMYRQSEIESVWQSLRGTQDNVEMLGRELERSKQTDASDLLGEIAALLNEGGYGA
jgi:hypothetical protein